ncbi:MAG: polysaccharide deacetylase family protein [Oligoflexia bacterium]|nr:polysaccharide deacetylase family protein [Oligoflexia bacterium]
MNFFTFKKKIKVALSFDDAPTIDSVLFSGEVRSQKLLEQLSKKKIQEAAFFCNTKKEQNILQLSKYASAGHIIGNHTSTHPDLTKVSAEEFIRAIEEADTLLKKLPTYSRWFRYPYLREAHKQADKNRTVKEYLDENEYLYGYITIESYDWYLDELYQENKNTISENVFKKFYAQILHDTLLDGCSIAKECLGKQPVHVLLLHENDVNALFLSEFINLAQSNGFEFVSMKEAYSDSIANKKWDRLPQSMRRPEGIAKEKKLTVSTQYRWLDCNKIKSEFLSKIDTI